MGHSVTHDWTTQDDTRPRSEWADGDVAGITAANLLICLFEKELDYSGSLTEMGIAISQGTKVWIVGNGADKNIFCDLSDVVRFETTLDIIVPLSRMTCEEILS